MPSAEYPDGTQVGCECSRPNCIHYHDGETYHSRIARLTNASRHRESLLRSGERCEACVFDGPCSFCLERQAARDYAETRYEAFYPSAEEVAAWELEIAQELARQRQFGRLSGETVTDRWGHLF